MSRKSKEKAESVAVPPTEPVNPADDPTTPEGIARYDAETVELVNEANEETTEAVKHWLDLKQRASDAKKSAEGRQAELRSLIDDREKWRGKKKPADNLFAGKKPEDEPKGWRSLPLSALRLDNDVLKIVADAGIRTVGDLDEWYSKDAPLNESQVEAVGREIEAATKGERNPPAAEPADELWRQFPVAGLTEFGLSESDVKKLHTCTVKRTGEAFPIRTMGDLNRFVQPNPAMPEFTRGYQDVKGLGPAGVDRVSEAETKFWSAWNAGLKEKFAQEQGHGVQEPAADTGKAEAA